MNLKLTLKQKAEYYFVILFILLTPGFLIYELIKNHWQISELKASAPGIIFLLLALIVFWIRKKQLKFLEIRISVTKEEFKKVIDICAKQLEWTIEKQTGTYIRAFRGPDVLGSEMITIYRTKDSVFINCIPDPNHKAALTTFGLRKTHLKTFSDILCKVKMGVPIVFPDSNKWTFTDYLIRILGYTICLTFIGSSVFIFFPNGDYLPGIILGGIGASILILDLRNIFLKYLRRSRQ